MSSPLTRFKNKHPFWFYFIIIISCIMSAMFIIVVIPMIIGIIIILLSRNVKTKEVEIIKQKTIFITAKSLVLYEFNLKKEIEKVENVQIYLDILNSSIKFDFRHETVTIVKDDIKSVDDINYVIYLMV